MRALGPPDRRVERDPWGHCQPRHSPPWRSAPVPRPAAGLYLPGAWAHSTVWEGAEREPSLHSWAQLGGHGSRSFPRRWEVTAGGRGRERESRHESSEKNVRALSLTSPRDGLPRAARCPSRSGEQSLPGCLLCCTNQTRNYFTEGLEKHQTAPLWRIFILIFLPRYGPGFSVYGGRLSPGAQRLCWGLSSAWGGLEQESREWHTEEPVQARPGRWLRASRPGSRALHGREARRLWRLEQARHPQECLRDRSRLRYGPRAVLIWRRQAERLVFTEFQSRADGVSGSYLPGIKGV